MRQMSNNHYYNKIHNKLKFKIKTKVNYYNKIHNKLKFKIKTKVNLNFKE